MREERRLLDSMELDSIFGMAEEDGEEEKEREAAVAMEHYIYLILFMFVRYFS